MVAPGGRHVWLLQGAACMVALGGHAWLLGGACMVAGCSGGVCVVARGACMVAGCSGGACMVAPGGACVVFPGGHAWLLVAPGGGMHGCSRGACVVFPGGACIGYDEIRSMRGRYASYWNAFLLRLCKDIHSNIKSPLVTTKTEKKRRNSYTAVFDR